MTSQKVKMRPVTTGSNLRRSYNKVIDNAGDDPYASMYQAAFCKSGQSDSKKGSRNYEQR